MQMNYGIQEELLSSEGAGSSPEVPTEAHFCWGRQPSTLASPPSTHAALSITAVDTEGTAMGKS